MAIDCNRKLSEPSEKRLTESQSASLAIGVALLIVIATVSYMGFRTHRSFFHDDAYITLRYAQHWQAGIGPVWNQDERVEGYTSFLHLALLSLIQPSEDSPEPSARLISLIAYGGIWIFLLIYSWRRHRTRHLRLSQLLILLSTLATSFPIVAWTLGGLETTLYTLLVMCSIYLFADYSIRLNASRIFIVGLIFALAMMTRPEAAIFVVVSVLTCLLVTKSPKTTLLLILSVAVFYVPYFLWRWNYYGELLPNTYHAKLGTPMIKRLQDGFYYLHTYARSAPWLTLLAIACWLHTLIMQKSHRTTAWKYMTAICITGSLYIVWTGGDHMPAYRFWAPMTPLFAWLVAHPFMQDKNPNHRRPLWIMPTVLIVISVFQFASVDQSIVNARRPDPAGAVGKQVGRYLEANFPKGSLVATNSAGAVAFFAPSLRFIDMLGLNDRQISRRSEFPWLTHWQQFPGHAKGDGEYVLGRQPDVIILGPAEGTIADSANQSKTDLVWFLSDQELAQNQQFYQQYELQTVRINDTVLLTYYQRK